VGLVQAALVAKKGFETYAKCLASSKKHAQHLAKTAWFVRLITVEVPSRFPVGTCRRPADRLQAQADATWFGRAPRLPLGVAKAQCLGGEMRSLRFTM